MHSARTKRIDDEEEEETGTRDTTNKEVPETIEEEDSGCMKMIANLI